MEPWLYLKAILTLSLLSGFLLTVLWVIKKYGTKLPLALGSVAPERIAIKAARVIDPRHRVVILSIQDLTGNDTEWTILLSPTGPVVLDSQSIAERHHA